MPHSRILRISAVAIPKLAYSQLACRQLLKGTNGAMSWPYNLNKYYIYYE
ncbi:hypothetical protein [Fodinibius sediminis]|nr:hypothetical protein [Fodinibius sediminis]